MIMVSLYDHLLSQLNLTRPQLVKSGKDLEFFTSDMRSLLFFQDVSPTLCKYELSLSLHYISLLALFLIFRQHERIDLVHRREVKEVAYGTWHYS